MGMLFCRVPADSTRDTYAGRLDGSVLILLGWPKIAPDPWSIIYTDADGVKWACPGNGDDKLTRQIVEQIAETWSHTDMDIFYREQGDLHGLTRVAEVVVP